MYQPIVYAAGLTDERAQHYEHQWFICDQHYQLIPKEAIEKKLTQLKCSIYTGCLRLRAPGMLMLELLLDVVEDDDSVRCQALVGTQKIAAINEGELVNTWFSRFLGRPSMCLKVDPLVKQAIHWP